MVLVNLKSRVFNQDNIQPLVVRLPQIVAKLQPKVFEFFRF